MAMVKQHIIEEGEALALRPPRRTSPDVQPGPFVWSCIYLDNGTQAMSLKTLGNTAVAVSGVTASDQVLNARYSPGAANNNPDLGFWFDQIAVRFQGGVETEAILRALGNSLYLRHISGNITRYLSLANYCETYSAAFGVSEAAATAVRVASRERTMTIIPEGPFFVSFRSDSLDVVPGVAVNAGADIPFTVHFLSAMAWDSNKGGVPSMEGCPDRGGLARARADTIGLYRLFAGHRR